jgi:hypothetical protein
MIPNLKPELYELIKNISVKNTYYGNRISPSIMKQFVIEETDLNVGILVPYWLPVTERGRGPRRSTKNFGLAKLIYNWMERKGLFTSATAKGKLNEARFVAYYINKHGNAQFRNKVFVDIYTSERKKTIEQIDKKFSSEINRITMQVI